MIPIRLDLLNGETKFRGVMNLDHSTLCRAFELDQASFWFDIPQTVHANPRSFSGRQANGTVHRGARGNAPCGKLTIAHEGERFRDVDPSDEREFFDMSRSLGGLPWIRIRAAQRTPRKTQQ